MFSCAVGREGCCKEILLACACSVSSMLGLPLLAAHTVQALCGSAGEHSEAGPRFHAPPRSKLLRLGPQEALRGADLVGCVLCPSQARVAQELGERGRCDLSPFPTLLPSFLGVQLAPLLRQMVTVQNPKKA